MAHVRLSRAERKVQIVSWMKEDQHDVHTVNSIAKLIGIKPSTYLRELLWELVATDFLLYDERSDDSGTVIKRWYGLPSRFPYQRELPLGQFNAIPF